MSGLPHSTSCIRTSPGKSPRPCIRVEPSGNSIVTLDREFKLYFLHVPKTAGTSLRYWLWDAFASEDFVECHRVVDLDAADSARIEKARFYSGHFGPLSGSAWH